MFQRIEIHVRPRSTAITVSVLGHPWDTAETQVDWFYVGGKSDEEIIELVTKALGAVSDAVPDGVHVIREDSPDSVLDD